MLTGRTSVAVLWSAARLTQRASRRAIVSTTSTLRIGTWKTENHRRSLPSPLRCASTNNNNNPSSSSSPSEDKDNSTWNRIVRQVTTPKNQFYALVAGGAVVSYGLSKMFLLVTGFFTHLTPTVVAKWGFYTGFGTAGLIGMSGLVAADVLYIRADPVYRYTLSKIQNHPQVQQVLGDGLEPGDLRSYRLDAGRFEFTSTSQGSSSSSSSSSSSLTPVWRPARIQMIFDVTATGPPYRTGIVTCEATKLWGIPPSLQTTILKVDYETGNGATGDAEGDETLWLRGSPEDLARISKRSGLSLASIARQVHINKAAAATTNRQY
eukprot:scaffold1064_cov85-Amphora_coffeaeformis.AAC.12